MMRRILFIILALVPGILSAQQTFEILKVQYSSSSTLFTVNQSGYGHAADIVGPVQLANGLLICGGTTCPGYDQYGFAIAVNAGFNPWAVNGVAGSGDTTICDYIGCEADTFRIKGGAGAGVGDFFDWARWKADNSGPLPQHEVQFRDSSGNVLEDYSNTGGTATSGVFSFLGTLCIATSVCSSGTSGYSILGVNAKWTTGMDAPLVKIDNGSDYFEWLNSGLGTHHIELQDSGSNDLLDYANTSGLGSGGVFTFNGEVTLSSSSQIFSGAIYRLSNGSDYFEWISSGLGTHHFEIQDSGSNDLLDYANSTGTWNDGTFTLNGNLTITGICTGCAPASGTVTSVTIAGTTNQINISGACTSMTVINCTLTLPQAINTTAVPQFGGLLVNQTNDSSGYLVQVNGGIEMANASDSIFSKGNVNSVSGYQTNGSPTVNSSNQWVGAAIANSGLVNSSVTISSGTCISGGGTVSLGSSLTLSTCQNFTPAGVPQFAGLLINQTNDGSGYLVQVNGGIEMANTSGAIFSKGIFEVGSPVASNSGAYRVYDQSGGGSYSALYRTGGNVTYLFDSVLGANVFGVNDSGEVFATSGYTANGSSGVTKTCTTFPTVVGGIVVSC